jgi:peptidoglycan L-alanyl-D-glutamate endopeptidase CwlK
MDANSEARLLEVNSVLAGKIRTLATMLAQEGIEIRVTQGFRTWAQQHALYLQGRAEISDVNACRANCGMPPLSQGQNYRVTKADAGYSWHNYGLAVDVAPFKNNRPVWDDKDPSWDRIVMVGESLGLRSGLAWDDKPHFELTGKFGEKPPDDVVATYKQANEHGSGSQAVWEVAGIDA